MARFPSQGWFGTIRRTAAAFAVAPLLSVDSSAEVSRPWAWQPVAKPAVPDASSASGGTGIAPTTNPVDAFVRAKLFENGLVPSPPADPYTLARRLWVDLLGILPTPEESDAFARDLSPATWERVVERLLADPRHGERWARHWMDAVHFAETHGHDEDVIRENAWPYRDFLIRAFNADMPYPRFARLQIAGDKFEPENPDAIAALGFLAAGPWDQSSQMGIQDGTLDKEKARYLDRDDMLTTVCSTFLSASVHCARCHDHKLDPITQEDYYAFQAVFAGVDRVDRPYDSDPEVHRKRLHLGNILTSLEAGTLPAEVRSDSAVAAVLDELEDHGSAAASRWTILHPKAAASSSGATLTVLDDASVFSSGTRPEQDVVTLHAPVPEGKLSALRLETLTDLQLPHSGPGRQDNGNLHLSEFEATLHLPSSPAAGVPLTFRSAAADFDQAGWTAQHAVDGNPSTAWGIYPAVGVPHQFVVRFRESIDCPPGSAITVRLHQVHGGGHLIGKARLSASSNEHAQPAPSLPPEIKNILALTPEARSTANDETLLRYAAQLVAGRALQNLPPPQQVYAIASQFDAQGNFQPARGCRPVHVLLRGDVLRPAEPAVPGAISSLPGASARFDLINPTDEAARRAALADWIVHPDNPLFWRSAVNRVWQHHFGRGLVATANDFGKLGEEPSHPELLDWLAASFRESGGSLRWLHRLIVTSETYKQASFPRPDGVAADAENRLLWRMSPQRLESECVRDAILQISGQLDLKMGGPSARQFLTRPGIHQTPIVDYLSFDPADASARRRSVYRFLFRTLPDPFHQALDCPDASQLSPARNSAATVQQSLALLHDRFLVHQAEQASRRFAAGNPRGETAVAELLCFAWSRPPEPSECDGVAAYANKHGLANACRFIFNTNEFLSRP